MEFAISKWDLGFSGAELDALFDEGVRVLEAGPEFLFGRDDAGVHGDVRRLEEHGMSVTACHTVNLGENDVSSSDEAVRRTAVANHAEALRLGAIAGIRYLIVHPGKDTDALRASLVDLLPHAQATGVAVAVENLWFGNPEGFAPVVRRVVDEFDSPLIGVVFDTGHAHLLPEGLVGAFRLLKDRIIGFHIDDNDGNADKHLQPPYGVIDWPAFIAEFETMDFPHPVVIEAPPWGGAPWSVLLREVKALFDGGLVELDHNGWPFRATCPRCRHCLVGDPDNPTCACAG